MQILIALAPWAVIIGLYSYLTARNIDPLMQILIVALVGFPTVVASFLIIASM